MKSRRVKTAEQRLRNAIGYWQKRTFTQCFMAWAGIIKGKRRSGLGDAVGATLHSQNEVQTT